MQEGYSTSRTDAATNAFIERKGARTGLLTTHACAHCAANKGFALSNGAHVATAMCRAAVTTCLFAGMRFREQVQEISIAVPPGRLDAPRVDELADFLATDAVQSHSNDPIELPALALENMNIRWTAARLAAPSPRWEKVRRPGHGSKNTAGRPL